MPIAIVVSGFPAGGKSTVAKRIAAELDWPLFDKDEFLENLFEDQCPVSLHDRRRLSILSDVEFEKAARKANRAVLVSHWRPVSGPNNTGTPVDFVTDHFGRVIEVHCVCSVETAVSRFRARVRHQGHMDAVKSYDDVKKQIQVLERGYPLGIGIQLSLVTSGKVSYDKLLDRIRSELA